MSINAYKPHLLVLPEDDANREMANGFLLDSRVLMCNMQVLPPAGGWKKALDSLQNKHAQGFLNLDSSVGRARVDRWRRVWVGATTTRAPAR